MGTRVRYDSPSTAALLGKPGLVGGTRADVVVLDVGDLDVRLGVVLHECLHNGGVVLLVLHEPLHLGAVLQLGQRRPQDLDPRRGEQNVRPVVALQYPPHLHGEVLELGLLRGVGLLVLDSRTRADVVVPRLSELDVHLSVVELHDFPHLGAGAVVVSPRLVLLVHGFHLGAELQLGQRLPQDLDLPRHVELVHDLKLLLLA